MASIAPIARMTLSEWIEHDDGDTPSTTVPACTEREQALHAHVTQTPGQGERLQPPPGLALPPLG